MSDGVMMEKIRQCLHSEIQGNRLVPDYCCTLRKQKPTCHLLTTGCCTKWEQFPTRHDT